MADGNEIGQRYWRTKELLTTSLHELDLLTTAEHRTVKIATIKATILQALGEIDARQTLEASLLQLDTLDYRQEFFDEIARERARNLVFKALQALKPCWDDPEVARAVHNKGAHGRDW